jgi:hypothetical protein
MIIRIDDFPTGITEVPEDMSLHFKILDCFEEEGREYYLGIVPELLRRYVNKENIRRLFQYKMMIPVMHGYDHYYDTMQQRLIANNDPMNLRGTSKGDFWEFTDRSQQWTTEHLIKGKEYIESLCGKRITHYIPVCNRIDEKLINGLIGSGFTTIFTIPGNTGLAVRMAQVITEYYGKVVNMDKRYESICLHITWERDTIIKTGFDEWKKYFYKYIA